MWSVRDRLVWAGWVKAIWLACKNNKPTGVVVTGPEPAREPALPAKPHNGSPPAPHVPHLYTTLFGPRSGSGLMSYTTTLPLAASTNASTPTMPRSARRSATCRTRSHAAASTPGASASSGGGHMCPTGACAASASSAAGAARPSSAAGSSPAASMAAAASSSAAAASSRSAAVTRPTRAEGGRQRMLPSGPSSVKLTSTHLDSGSESADRMCSSGTAAAALVFPFASAAPPTASSSCSAVVKGSNTSAGGGRGGSGTPGCGCDSALGGSAAAPSRMAVAYATMSDPRLRRATPQPAAWPAGRTSSGSSAASGRVTCSRVYTSARSRIMNCGRGGGGSG